MMYLVDPADVDTWLSGDDTDPVVVTILIFTRDATRGGQWSLDEWLPVCLGGNPCDVAYTATEVADDALFPAPATPSTTPAAGTRPSLVG